MWKALGKLKGLGAVAVVIVVFGLLFAAEKKRVVEIPPTRTAEYTMPPGEMIQDFTCEDLVPGGEMYYNMGCDTFPCCDEACYWGPCDNACTCCTEENDSEFGLAIDETDPEPDVTDEEATTDDEYEEDCDEGLEVQVIGFGVMKPVLVPMGFGMDKHGRLSVIYAQAYQLQLALIDDEGNFKIVDCPPSP